jgi:hypothetical protein
MQNTRLKTRLHHGHSQLGLAHVLTWQLIFMTVMLLSLPGWLPAQTLLHRYSFVSDASDSVGGTNWNGKIVAPNGGSPATIADGLSLPGNAAGGNGVSGYVALPNGILTNTASITVDCWLSQNQYNEWAEAWDFGNNGNQNFALIPDPASGRNNGEMVAAFTPNGGENDLDTPTVFPDGQELYVSLTFNSTTLVGNLYTNGILNGTITLPNSTYIPGTIGGAGGTTENWLGNDVYGDPQFAGTIYELRIWNGVVPPLYLTASAAAGPRVVITNTALQSLSVAVNATMVSSQTQQAAVFGNFLQITNVSLTTLVGTWTSSNTNVLTVNGSGLITAIGAGNAKVTATVYGYSATSATITVEPPALLILQGPANVNAVPGKSAVFSVQALGQDLSYQWSFDETPIAGATNATLTLPDVTSANAGTYSVLVSNPTGSTNLSALLTISPAALLHRYSFTSDASDSIGDANGTVIGNAYIANGLLNMPGGGNADNPEGYAALPNGIVTNDTSITVECWLTDTAGSIWAETWCFGDSGAGPGAPPTSGTSYISLIPHSGDDDFRAAFNLTGGDEVDVVDSAGPLPLNSEQYAVVTYDAASATARLYLNGVQVGVASISTNQSPAAFGDTFNNWIGRDEFGGDPMFAGSIDELRIWNTAVSPSYVALSAVAGPNVVVTDPNPAPVSVSVTFANTNLIGGQPVQASVYADFLQLSNVLVTSAATNWSSSDPSVLTVSGSGLITPVGNGNATVSATYDGVTGTSTLITVSPIQTVGYWQFNNPANLGADSSGLGNNLTTASGAPTYSSTGKFGGSLYLNGASTMTTLSGAFPLYIPVGASPYTIAVWERTDVGCPIDGGFIGWGNANNDNCNSLRLSDLGDNPDSIDNYWWSNDYYIDNLATNPADGNWHAIVATWDGTTQTIYIDGVNVGSRIPAAAPDVQADGFIVGQTTGDANDFKGWMEDLLIANIAMTPADVAVYQAGDWSAALPAYPEQPTAFPGSTTFAGTTVTLSVLVAGIPPFEYQWQENGTNISWGTGATLVLTNAVVADSGSYDVIVGNASGTNTSPALAVTINPASAPVITTQPEPAATTNYLGSLVTFAAAVEGTQPIRLQWQHNGVNIPNATSSSLTLASLQSSEAGSYTLLAANLLGSTNSLPSILTVLPPPNPGALNFLTYHNDNTRQGANTNEVLLTHANVNAATFGRLLTYPTDGLIIMSPLYVSGLVIPGRGTHNAVFVATENDTIYAFDADSNAGTNGGVLWETNLGPSVSSYDDQFGNRGTGSYYPDITPVVGITGTPVIDLASGTLYVNVHTATTVGSTTTFYHRIHALNITNGTEQAYSPVVVTNAFPGTGVDGSNGIVPFDPRTENQRPGVTLAGGMVYVGYGSYADTDPYHGWVLGFNATNLAQSSAYAFNTTPNATVAAFGVNAGEGALWMGGDGLCADTSNNLYFATANGSFSENTNGRDYGDSFVRLSTTNGLGVADYFTPYNEAELAANDTDLGSGGTILLPDAVGSAAHPHLMIGCGKDGTLRLVDRDNMGHFNAANDNQIVQEVPGAITGAWSTPAYFNNHIYYQGAGDVMKAFLITNGVIRPTPTSEATTTFSAFATGGAPVISANGTNNGIVWATQSDAAGSGGPAVLHAYNADNLAQELYNSSQNLARDNPGAAIIMTTPTEMNGKVFVGAQYQLSIFGNSLFLATPVISPAGGLFTNEVTVTLSDATPNSTIYYTLDGTAPTTNSPVYTGPFVLTTSASVQVMASQPGAANSGVASASFVDSSATGTGTGLLGAYWTNVTSVAFTNLSFAVPPTLVRTDAMVNFDWASTPPAANIGLTNFAVRWIGSLLPEYGETYTFSVDSDSGVRLYVNDQLLINKWVDQPATTWSNSITLTAQQRYNIELDYFNQAGGAVAQLYWSSPSTAFSNRTPDPTLPGHESAAISRLVNSDKQSQLHGERERDNERCRRRAFQPDQ